MARCFRPRALPMKWKFRRFITSRLIKLSRLDDMSRSTSEVTRAPWPWEKGGIFTMRKSSCRFRPDAWPWIFMDIRRSNQVKQKLGNQSGRKKKIEKKYGSSFEAVAACGGKPIKFELKSMIVVLYTAWGQPVEGRASPQEPERSPMECYSTQDFFLGSLSDRACPTNIKQIPGAQLSRFEIQRSKLDILTYAKSLGSLSQGSCSFRRCQCLDIPSSKR